MEKKIDICGLVILYNPNGDAFENIRSYFDQVDFLIIVDNSATDNSEIIDQYFGTEKTKYISFTDNIGVAAALNVGAKIALEYGAQFLLTMDQDSKAPPSLVERLIRVFSEEKKAAIVSPLHSNRFNTHLAEKTSAVEKVVLVMTSGNLLSLEAYKKVGPFKENFFIDYVDIEYCFRLRANDYLIYRVNEVILQHNEAELSEKKLFSKKYYPHNHKPFRLYYKTRNLLYLRKLYSKKFPEFMKIEYDSYFRTVIKIFLFEKQKFHKFRMILSGLLDYFFNNIGRKF